MMEPFTVVLSESSAREYFGSMPLNDIVGKRIIYNDSLWLHISGIVKDWNKNTDFPFTDFISFSTINRSFLRDQIHTADWQPSRDNQWVWSFVKLSREVSPAQIRAQLAEFTNNHIKRDSLNVFSFQLQPLSDIHFNSHYDHEDIRKANLSVLYGLIAIALFIISIAVINYINIATALSTQRAREIGIRKVLGSSKTNLKIQFTVETFLLVCLALGLALAIKIASMKNILSQIEKKWHEIYPGRPFDYSFLDDSIASFYKKERQTAWLMNISMAVTIFISCMGLFGLALFSAAQKSKEISIRKVLGADIVTIIVMLCKSYLTLTLISFLLASPLALFVLKNWQQNFAYRLEIQWWVFLLAGGIAVLITLATISYHAVKAAVANPSKALRSKAE